MLHKYNNTRLMILATVLKDRPDIQWHYNKRTLIAQVETKRGYILVGERYKNIEVQLDSASSTLYLPATAEGMRQALKYVA